MQSMLPTMIDNVLKKMEAPLGREYGGGGVGSGNDGGSMMADAGRERAHHPVKAGGRAREDACISQNLRWVPPTAALSSGLKMNTGG